MKHKLDIIQQLLPKLEDYLLMENINIDSKGFFSCINKEHEDSTPSCSISGKYNKTVFHCFGCGTGGNIFHACNIIKGLPTRGAEFFTVTIPYLADKFHIKYDPRELTEQEKEIIVMKRAYRDAAEIITQFTVSDWNKDPLPNHVKMIKDRSINLDSVQILQIGAIPSIEEYVKKMNFRGWDEEYMVSHSLLELPMKPFKIFDTDKIIITVCNHRGEPVAFVSRKHDWKEGDTCPKYVNTNTTSIYKKGNILYGLHLAKSHIKKKSLYIVEGYIDAITLRQAGFLNVAAIGSADLGIESIQKFDEDGIEVRDIVFSFDGDAAGIEGTRKALEKLENVSNIGIRVKQLPNTPGYCDPDEIIRSSGIKAYEILEEFTDFKWLLKFRDSLGVQEEAFVVATCKTIAKDDSPIARRTKARDLKDLCTFTLDEIMAEIDTLRKDTSAKMRKELESVIDDLVSKRVQSRSSPIELLTNALSRARQIEKDHLQRRGDLSENYKKNIDSIREEFNTTEEINGFRLTRFKTLESVLDGFPNKECLITVAGDSNLGKSSFMREISWDIATTNKDAVVIYMSIDDSIRDVMQALVARESDLSRDRVYKIKRYPSEVQDRVDSAWEKVKSVKNYFVCDSTQGSTIVHLQDHISYALKNFPGKKPILFLDNFHKLRFDSNDIRAKFIDLSQSIKDTTQVYDMPIVMTVELRKHEWGKVANLSDIAETKKIEYDSKIVFMIHSELHYNENTSVKWMRENYDPIQYMPYLEARIKKNKHTDKKCNLAYRFEPDRSILTECQWSEIEAKRSGKGRQDSDLSNNRSESWSQQTAF